MPESCFRSRVYWLTFLLSLLVIWVHSYNAELFLEAGQARDCVNRLEQLIGNSLGQIAVPGFFVVSAYLFYRRFTLKKLRDKWRSRIKSLAVPYVLWNILYYFGYIAATRLPVLSEISGKGPIPVSVQEFFQAAVYYKYNPVFWYLFQLIILVALAPVLYALLRKNGPGLVFMLILVYGLWKNKELPLLNLDALFYYSAGAFIALHKDGWGRFVEAKVSLRQGIRSLFLLLLSFALLIFLGQPGGPLYLLPLYTVLWRFLGVCAAVFAVKFFPFGMEKEWMRHNFFLYAIHFALVRLINKMGAHFLPPKPAVALGLFLLMPVFMVAASAGIRKILMKICPRAYGILAGGR
jgi:peptidoglycan/LPS O-acetylase OafA/YrhL